MKNKILNVQIGIIRLIKKEKNCPCQQIRERNMKRAHTKKKEYIKPYVKRFDLSKEQRFSTGGCKLIEGDASDGYAAGCDAPTQCQNESGIS